MSRNIAVFMARHPPPVPPIEVHDAPSDPRGAGKCAFARKDVERGQVVAEYTGELISMTEATKREAEYARVGKTCTLMVIDHRGQSIAIDPYYGDIHAELNLAATINHSRQNANLKPYVDDTSSRARVFFVALHDIPQSVEFLWNYGDADWEYHTNSQTLPH
ncbi:SET domain containing (lysine methyltransferase) 8a [Porites harrisoni]